MPRPRAVTFDLDHTLWDLEDVIPRAERRMYEFLCERYPRVGERYGYEELAEQRMEGMRRHRHLAHNVTELRKAVLRELAHDCGYGEEMVEEGFDVFLEGRHDVILYDDVMPVLKTLRQENYVLGVITNGNADIQRIGLGGHFDFAVSAIGVGAAKPDRIIFEAACHRAGVAPGEAVHVGDEVGSDVIGAADYGMHAVWLNRAHKPWPEGVERVDHTEMADLTGFADWLGGLGDPD